MEVGSMYIVFSFPVNFPEGIQNQIELLSSPADSSTFKIYAFPDGHLLVLVQNQDITFSKFESQRIRFQYQKDSIITYIWSKTQATLKINEHFINSIETSEIILISDKPLILQEEQTNTDLRLNINFDKWISWRKERFNFKGKAKSTERREKSETEQVNELSNVLENIEDNFNGWLSGKTYLTISLLSLLRSLLCHKIDDKRVKQTYNPLLFRVASFKLLPLPIYARPVNIEIPKDILELSKDTISHVIINEPSFIKTSNSQILMDFQEWLNGEVLISYENNTPVYFSVNEMLMESSNTIGGSHFDPDVPLKIDFLKKFTTLNVDFINRIVLMTCQISIYHCKKILSEFNNEISNI